ncbi:MAG: stage II sporulation protein M [Planctomycetes bacterium]|nr:stage II sporulation protein M [Planctomycetota bacterium]
MKVVQLLDARRRNWRDLDETCSQMESRRKRKIGAVRIARFAALYRSACADLALADAYQLPPNTIQYLHQLVGRCHNQIYRSRSFMIRTWLAEAFLVVPQRIFLEKCMWFSFVLFWGTFLGAMFLAGHPASPYPDFAKDFVGQETLNGMSKMHENSVSSGGSASKIGWYLVNNGGIGLRCFVLGLFIVPGIFVIAYNGATIGTVFGYMYTQPQWGTFSQFVTAHAPFELMAVVIAGAAGFKLGFSVIETGGLSRGASLRKAGRESVPLMCVFTVLFCLAALIEGTLSPSSAPYWTKALVAVISSGILMFYFAVLGFPKGGLRATR